MKIETPDKVITPVATNSDLGDLASVLGGTCEKICGNDSAKAIVLNLVLQEILKLQKGKSIGFDFGNKKDFKLSRIN